MVDSRSIIAPYCEEFKKKEPIEKAILISVVLILAIKPISDMFYATQIIDMVLLGLAIFAAPISMCVRRYRITRIDTIPFVWMALCLISLMMSGGSTVWIVWVKVMSIFPLYLLGKFLSERDSTFVIKICQISYLIVLITNIIVILMGQGYKEWAQGAQTFCGVYYFKTDLALAMAQVILFFLTDEKLKIHNYLIIVIAMILALLSNSRIFFAIILLIITICGVWGHMVSKKLNFLRIAVVLATIMLVSIMLIALLASLPFFKARNFISFTTEGSLWDMLIYNLMYRNVIWKEVLEYYFKGDILHILFGKGFTFDIPWYDAHSLYVSTLYKFGVVGIIALCALIAWAWKLIRDYSDGQIYFLNMGLWIVFLVAGISYTTGESTQYTWLVAMFMGAVSGKTTKGLNETCSIV